MADLNYKDLESERKSVEEDFQNTQMKIKQVETDLVNLKSNLSALYGAAQMLDKLIIKSKEGIKSESRKTADKMSAK